MCNESSDRKKLVSQKIKRQKAKWKHFVGREQKIESEQKMWFVIYWWVIASFKQDWYVSNPQTWAV